jgi:hypothetical protein
MGGSEITAYSTDGGVQWFLSMISDPALPYSGGAPLPSASAPDWEWQTDYEGTITIGGSLTTGDFVTFDLEATNYNVTYGLYPDPLYPLYDRDMLEWTLEGYGTYDGYEMGIVAYYYGAPLPLGGETFGDLTDYILMEMTIKGPAGVPEPATMLLLGCGLIGLAAVGRKKFFKKS